MTKTELAGAIGQAMDDGQIDRQKGEALLALLSIDSRFGAEQNVGAIDWAKLLDMVQKLLPVIVQLLPIIMAIFTPKQPPTPIVNPQPTPDIGVK